MVIFRAARYVSMKWESQVRRSIMSADGFICRMGYGHFIEHFRIAHKYTEEVHHFTQADDALPLHRLCHFLRTDMRAGSFQPRRGWNAGGHLHPNMDGLLLGFVHHQL